MPENCRFKRSVLSAAMVLVFFFQFSAILYAAEYYGFHRGVRPLGMGGAFTAVADDVSGVYFNPAGLADLPGFTLGILDPMVGVSENTVDLYDDYDEIDTDDVTEVTELMRKYVGENNHVEAAFDLHLGFRMGRAGILVSAIAQSDSNIRIRNPVNPQAHITSINDYGGMLSMGVAVPGLKGLKLGGTIKALQRKSLNEVYSATVIADDDLGDLIDDDTKDGSGVTADLGAIYTFNLLKVTDISIGVAGINIPEVDYGDAMDGKSQVNAGVAFRQKLLGFTLTEALDVYDVTDNVSDDSSFEKKVHMGAELKFPWLISVRAGLNQGYYTAGATLNFKILKVDVATYGEEIGMIAGQKEDRRYAGSISLGWLW